MSRHAEFLRIRTRAAALGLTLVCDDCGFHLAPAADALRVGATWQRFDNDLAAVESYLRRYAVDNAPAPRIRRGAFNRRGVSARLAKGTLVQAFPAALERLGFYWALTAPGGFRREGYAPSLRAAFLAGLAARSEL